MTMSTAQDISSRITCVQRNPDGQTKWPNIQNLTFKKSNICQAIKPVMKPVSKENPRSFLLNLVTLSSNG